MRTRITTRLDCTPERAWEALQTTRLLEYVAAPVLGFEPLQPRRLSVLPAPAAPLASAGETAIRVWLILDRAHNAYWL